MKKHLNFYYLNHRKSISFLMIVNFFYFLISFVYSLIRSITHVNIQAIVGFNTDKSYSQTERILFLIILIFININLYIYALLNSKSVKFKDWMIDVMIGYRVIHEYWHWSIFILQNKVFKSRNSTLSYKSLPSLGKSTWMYYSSSIQFDIDDSDEYMRNYKKNFVETKIWTQLEEPSSG